MARNSYDEHLLGVLSQPRKKKKEEDESRATNTDLMDMVRQSMTADYTPSGETIDSIHRSSQPVHNEKKSVQPVRHTDVVAGNRTLSIETNGKNNDSHFLNALKKGAEAGLQGQFETANVLSRHPSHYVGIREAGASFDPKQKDKAADYKKKDEAIFQKNQKASTKWNAEIMNQGAKDKEDMTDFEKKVYDTLFAGGMMGENAASSLLIPGGGVTALAGKGLIKAGTMIGEKVAGKAAIGAAEKLGIAGATAAKTGGHALEKIGENIVRHSGGEKFLTAMGASVFGQSYDYAVGDGANDKEATAYAVAEAAKEVLTEKIFAVGKLFRGMSGAGMVDVESLAAKGLQKLMGDKAVTNFAQFLVKTGTAVTTEGAEEFIADIFDPIIKKAAYAPDEEIDWGAAIEQGFYDFQIGAALGGVLGGVGVAADMHQNRNLVKDIGEKKAKNKVIAKALTKDESTPAYQMAQEIQQKEAQGINTPLIDLAHLERANQQAEVQDSQAHVEHLQKVGSEIQKQVKQGGLKPTGERPTTISDYNTNLNEITAKAETMGVYGQRDGVNPNAELMQHDVIAITNISVGQAQPEDINQVAARGSVARALYQEHTGIELPSSQEEAKAVLRHMNTANAVEYVQKDAQASQDAVKAAVVSQSSENFGKAGQEAFQSIASQPNVDAGTMREMADGFEKLYRIGVYGKAGQDAGQLLRMMAKSLPNSLQELQTGSLKAIIQAGLDDAIAEEGKAKAKAETIKAETKKQTKTTKDKAAFTDLTGGKHSFSKDQVGMLKMLVNLFGVNINIHNVLKDAKGKDVEAGTGTYENGTINIVGNAKDPISVVFKHEITHHLQQVAPEEYLKLKKIIMKRLVERKAYEIAVQEKIYEYKINGVDITRAKAEDEIVSSSAWEFMLDQKFMEDVANNHASLTKKILESIMAVIRKFTPLLNTVTDANKQSMLKELGILKEAQEAWLTAMAKAAENNAKVESDLSHMFVGAEGISKTAKAKALIMAERMESEGTDVYEIYAQTKLFRAPDKKWRMFVDDSTTKFIPPVGLLASQHKGKLGDLLKGSTLFTMYPELANIQVVRTMEMDKHNLIGNFTGSVSQGTGTINLAVGMNRNEATAVLLHEVQHAIQNIEGHWHGAAVQDWSEEVQKLVDNHIVKEVTKKKNEQAAATAEFLAKRMSAEDYFKLFNKIESTFNAHDVKLYEIAHTDPKELYKNTLGEQEADKTEELLAKGVTNPTYQQVKFWNDNTVAPVDVFRHPMWSIDTDAAKKYKPELDKLYDKAMKLRDKNYELQKSIKAIEESPEADALTKKMMEAASVSNLSPEFTAEFNAFFKDMVRQKDEMKAAQNKIAEIYKQVDEINAQMEREIFEGSGKTEAAYYTDRARKEYGYTPYVAEAGYMLSDGKMLNFSGEKGVHRGSRGQDHRNISSIMPREDSADNGGTKAMVHFMHMGNIRLMPESPGIDIGSSLEPTQQQYSALRSFFMKLEGPYYVDITGPDGYVLTQFEFPEHTSASKITAAIHNSFVSNHVERSAVAEFHNTMWSLESPPGFYSRLAETVKGYNGNKISIDGLIPFLKGRGVKDDEIKWMDLAFVLESRKFAGDKSIDKQELLDGLNAMMSDMISEDIQKTAPVSYEPPIAETREIYQEIFKGWGTILHKIREAYRGKYDQPGEFENETRYTGMLGEAAAQYNMADRRLYDTYFQLKRYSDGIDMVHPNARRMYMMPALDELESAQIRINMLVKSVFKADVTEAKNRMEAENLPGLPDLMLLNVLRSAFEGVADKVSAELHYATFMGNIFNMSNSTYTDDMIAGLLGNLHGKEADKYTPTKYGTYSLFGKDHASHDYREILLRLPTIGDEGKVNSHWEQDNVVAHGRVSETTEKNTGGKLLFIDEIQSDWHQQGRDKGYEGQGPSAKELSQLSIEILDANYDIWLGNLYPDGSYTLNKGLDQSVDNILGVIKGDEKFSGKDVTYIKELQQNQEEHLKKAIARLAGKEDEIFTRFLNGGSKIPNAPFADNWAEVMAKRLIQEAVSGEADYVAWTTGQMQMTRYGLTAAQNRQLRTITVTNIGISRETGVVEQEYDSNIGMKTNIHDENNKNTGEDYVVVQKKPVWEVSTWDAEDNNIQDYKLSETEIYSTFGKTLGDKIMQKVNSRDFNDMAQIEVEESDMASESGMSSFYDQGGRASNNLPKFLKKYIKQWGAEITDITLGDTVLKKEQGSGDFYPQEVTVPGFKITEEMRNSIKNQGQPLWSLDTEGRELTKGQDKFFEKSQARDALGRLVRLFHGTNYGGFTVFEKTDDIGYFFGDHEVASTYTHSTQKINIPRFKTWGELLEYLKPYAPGERFGRDEFEKLSIEVKMDEDGTYWIGNEPFAEDELKFAEDYVNQDLLGGDYSNGLYEVYLDLKDPMIIDGAGANWDSISDGGMAYSIHGIEVREQTGGINILLDVTDNGEFEPKLHEFSAESLGEDDIMTAFMNEFPGMDETVAMDIAGAISQDSEIEHPFPYFHVSGQFEVGHDGGPVFRQNTRALVAEAVDMGHDGLIIRNISDNGGYGRGTGEGDVYVALHPNQIKSIYNQEPTTDDDIRYSLDANGRQLTEKQQAYFYNTRVRDMKGRLLPVFHGTAADISIFSEDFRGQTTQAYSASMGYFFTTHKELALGYAEFSRPQDIVEMEKEYKRLEKIAQRSGKNSDWEKHNEAYLKYEEAEIDYGYNRTGRRDESEKAIESYLKMTNPMVHDFNGAEYRDESYADIIKLAKQEGKDGVIFFNTYDGWGEHDSFQNPKTDIYMVFDSNQIKSVDNFAPTEDPDIRFSIDGKAGFTKERIAYLYEEYASPYHMDYSKGYLTYMSPDDYLSLTSTPAMQENLRAETNELAPNGLDESILAQTGRASEIRLSVDINTGEVIGHEGRHRMILLRDRGIKSVPIVIRKDIEAGKYSMAKIDSLRLTGQGFAPGKVVVNSLYPISMRYKDTINELFVTPEADVRYSLDSTGKQLTNEQQQYFAQSKVRDEFGLLLKMYHGSHHDFTVFDTSENAGIIRGASFFSSRKSKAESYAESYDEDVPSYVYSVYLDIRNPLEISDTKNQVYLIPQEIRDKYRSSFKVEDMAANRSYVIIDFAQFVADREGSTQLEILKSWGFDGLHNDYDWAAFEPNQIKNVDNAAPTDAPDIRFSIKDNYGYHAGDLGKAESLFNMISGRRGTGHLGTGTYFVSSSDKIAASDSYSKRPMNIVDFSGYNLYRPTNAYEFENLFRILQNINYNILKLPEAKRSWDEVYSDTTALRQALNGDGNPWQEIKYFLSKYGDYKFDFRYWGKTVSEPKTRASLREHLSNLWPTLDASRADHMEYWNDHFPDTPYPGTVTSDFRDYRDELLKDFAHELPEMYREERGWYDSFGTQMFQPSGLHNASDSELYQLLDDIYSRVGGIKFYSEEADQTDSPSTMFMKAFGWEGVDVRHIPEADNFGHGSVIYDLKPGTEVQEPMFSMRTPDEMARTRLQEKVERLKLELKQTGGTIPKPAEVNQYANRLLKDYESSMSKSELISVLSGLYGDVQKKDAEVVMGEAMDIAGQIVRTGGQTFVYDDIAETKANVLAYLSVTHLNIPQSERNDYAAITGDKTWTEAKKKFSKFSFFDKGTSAENMLMEFNELFPEVVPEEMKTSNHINQMFAIKQWLENTQSKIHHSFDDGSEEGQELVMYITGDVLDTLGEMNPLKTFADRSLEMRKTMAAQYKEKLAAYKEDARARLAIEKLSGKEKTAKKEQYFRDKIDAIKQKEKNKKSESNSMARIWSNVKYLSDYLLKPTDKKHIPQEYREAIADFLSGINFITSRMQEGSKNYIKLEKLKDAYDKIVKDGNDDIVIDEEVVEIIDEMRKILNGRALEDLTPEELRKVAVITSFVRHSVAYANKAFNSDITEEISQMGNDVIEDAMTRKGSATGGLAGALTTGQIENTKPIEFFEMMNLSPMTKLYHALRRGHDAHVNNMTMVQTFMQKVVSENAGVEALKWSDSIKPVSAIKKAFGIHKSEAMDWTAGHAESKNYKLADGTSIDLIPAQVMSLYALSKRWQGLGHILGDGIVAAPLKRRQRLNKGEFFREGLEKLWKGDRINEYRVRITPEDLMSIIDDLSKSQTKIVDDIVEFMSTTGSRWGNETSMKLYGYEKFTEMFYFPIRSSQAYINENTESSDINYKMLENSGFTKAVTKNARNPIVIDDFFTVVTDHLNKMSMYNALVPQLKDFRRVYNYRQSNDDGGESVKMAITKGLNRGYLNYVDTLLRDVNLAPIRDNNLRIMDVMLANFKKAALATNLRVLIQQPTSFFRAIYMFDNPKYMAIAAGKKAAFKLNRQRMWDHIPIARWKHWGYSQTDVSQRTKDIVLGNHSLWNQMSMGAYGYADDMTWSVLFDAVEQETRAEHSDLAFESPEYWDRVNERFRDIVDHTQVVDTVFTRSQVMRSPNGIAKIVTSFMSEPTTQVNILVINTIQAKRLWQTGDKKGATKLMSKVIVSYMATMATLALAQSIVDAMRYTPTGDPDKDKKIKDMEYLQRLLAYVPENFVNNVNPLTMYPVLRDVNSIMSGFTVTLPQLQPIQNTWTSLTKLAKYVEAPEDSKYTLPYLLKEFAVSGASIFGISAKSMYRDTIAIAQTMAEALGYREEGLAMQDRFKYTGK